MGAWVDIRQGPTDLRRVNIFELGSMRIPRMGGRILDALDGRT